MSRFSSIFSYKPRGLTPFQTAEMLLPAKDRTAYEYGLLRRAADWPEYEHWSELTAEVLREIATLCGIDFATALLYDRIVRSPEHGPFLQQLESLPVEAAGSGRRLDATVVIVPGAFYIEHPHTGADGRLLREEAAKFGCRAELIPLASFGLLTENARRICDWLSGRPGENLILVSLSKGGADVKMALAEPDGARAFRNVVVWVNLCGLVNGTPLVTWLFAHRLRTLWYRLLFWSRGYNFEVIRELGRDCGGPLDSDLQLPRHVKVINVVGFPLARHMSNSLARRCYRRLRAAGPNDGAGILLADVCRLPGLVYPVWGADHYLRPAWGDVRNVAARLLHYLRDTWDDLVPQRIGTRDYDESPVAIARG
jgi:hypothetical protein